MLPNISFQHSIFSEIRLRLWFGSRIRYFNHEAFYWVICFIHLSKQVHSNSFNDQCFYLGCQIACPSKRKQCLSHECNKRGNWYRSYRGWCNVDFIPCIVSSLFLSSRYFWFRSPIIKTKHAKISRFQIFLMHVRIKRILMSLAQFNSWMPGRFTGTFSSLGTSSY